MANDILKMIDRCSDISSLSSPYILVGLLFGPAGILKFEIISITSSFVQGEMKNKSLSDVGKSKKKKSFVREWHL